jgi:FkbM family methyltransferase
MTQERKGFIYSLARIKAIHSLVRILGVYRAFNFLLRCFPIVRRFPRHNTVIRINSVSGLALAEEIFKTQAYREATAGFALRTFADLGCNVGWFPCYLLEATGEKGLSGLLIDGDPEMVAQARWHLEKNGLAGCHALCGVVGCATESAETDFFVNPANTQSSARAFGENHPFPVKGQVKQIKVPALSLARTWTAQFGATPIDLLKIDIEGMELEFLKAEMGFIQSAVKRIVCEWHSWHVSFEELDQFIEAHGFRMQVICEQDDKGGVAIYDAVKAGE